MGGDWQELAQAAVIGLLFAFLVAKLITTVHRLKEENLRITRSPADFPQPLPFRRSPGHPYPARPIACLPRRTKRHQRRQRQRLGRRGEHGARRGVQRRLRIRSRLRRVGTSVPEQAQLQLYGLYKIATEGPCTAPQPVLPQA
ncbi:hypothetical protein GUJ93_ZPchr0458g22708 [Zizania palustris]|uniref:ACB domain-containing protein n=1 Tax=Zizania palustris TaxID=103762 RepID=A0A8J5RMJ4_ZIZPA|nr:hypothetical protein GUJ93_ZPchr0458g22708 [Zizania palustris]